MSAGSTGEQGDRIFLRGYRRLVEIGILEEEHGEPQALRFDITLEVAGAGGASDEIEGVVSYTSLVEAIEAVATGPRLNLLETFAERLAERCLAEPRARRVDLRIEKLERLPGGAVYGVELARTQ